MWNNFLSQLYSVFASLIIPKRIFLIPLYKVKYATSLWPSELKKVAHDSFWLAAFIFYNSYMLPLFGPFLSKFHMSTNIFLNVSFQLDRILQGAEVTCKLSLVYVFITLVDLKAPDRKSVGSLIRRYLRVSVHSYIQICKFTSAFTN